jgi:RimJ/RimL family protein N-acetyltransferase
MSRPRGPVRLAGEKVVLRGFEPQEIDPALEAQRTVAQLVQPGNARDAARIRRILARSGRFIAHRITLAIEAGGRVIGDVDARTGPTFPPGVFELGIGIYVPSDRRRGYGSEAVSLLTDWLFDDAGAERVQAGTALSNDAMRATFERLGYRFEGTMRAFMPRGEGRDDYALYAVIRSEWRT